MIDIAELDRLHAAATPGVALHNAWPEVSALLRDALDLIEYQGRWLHKLGRYCGADGPWEECNVCGEYARDLLSRLSPSEAPDA